MFLFQGAGSVFKAKPLQKSEPNAAEQLESLKQEFYNLCLTQKTKDAKTYSKAQDKFYSNVKAVSSKLDGMKKEYFYPALGFCHASLLWLAEKGSKSAAEDMLALPSVANKSEDPTGFEKQKQATIRAFNYINATTFSFENRPLVQKGVEDLARAMDRASFGTDSGQWQFGVSSEKSANEFKKMLEKIGQVTGLQVTDAEIVNQTAKKEFNRHPGIPDNFYVSFTLKSAPKSSPNYLQLSPAQQEEQKQQVMGPLTKEQYGEQQKAEKKLQKIKPLKLEQAHSTSPLPKEFNVFEGSTAQLTGEDFQTGLAPGVADKVTSSKTTSTQYNNRVAVTYALRFRATESDKKTVEASIDEAILHLATLLEYKVELPVKDWLGTGDGQAFKQDCENARKASGTASVASAFATVDVISDGTTKGKNFDNLVFSVWNNMGLSYNRASLAEEHLKECGLAVSGVAANLYFFQDLKPEVIGKLISTFEAVQDSPQGMDKLRKQMAATIGYPVDKIAKLAPEQCASLVTYLKAMKESQNGSTHMAKFLKYLDNAANDPEFKSSGLSSISGPERKEARSILAKMEKDGAIAKGADDSYGIKNASKFVTYFGRTDRVTGGMRKEMLPGKAGSQNIFVRAMEESGEGFSRSVSYDNGVKPTLGVKITEISPTQAEIKTSYRITGVDRDLTFNEKKGHVMAFFYEDTGVAGEGCYKEVPLQSGNICTGDKKGVYYVDLPGKTGKLLGFARTTNGEANSGLVWKSVTVAPPPIIQEQERILSPETYEVVRAENIFDLEYAVPRSFAVTGLFPNSEYLMNNVLKPSYKKAFNADYNSATGEFNLPNSIDPSSIGVYRRESLPKLLAWLNEVDSNDEQGRTVREVLTPKLSTTPEKYVEALANNQPEEAQSYVKDVGLRKQLGEMFAKSKNYSLLLQQQHIADLMLSSFSSGAGVKFNLTPFPGTKETAAYVYVQHDATFLVTNVRLPRSMVSGKLAMTIDLGGTDFTPEIGAGVRLKGGGQKTMLQTKIGASLQIPGTVQGTVPAEPLISTIISASLTTTYHPDHDPFDAVRLGTGMKFRLAQQLSAKVHFERLLSPIKPLDFVNTTIAYKPYESLEIGATAGLGLQENVDNKLPYQVGLNITYTPFSPKKQK